MANSLPKVITNYIFDASLTREDGIAALLKSQPVGTAHSFTGNGKRELLYHFTPGVVATFDASGIDYSFFLNTAQLSAVEETIVKACDKYSQLEPFRDFTIQFAQPGTRLSVGIAKNQIFAFVVSDKQDSNYFDFVAQAPDQELCYYSYSSIAGMVHSGDVGSLLHTLTFERRFISNALLAAVGYGKRSLRYFTNQVPTFVIVDNENKVLHMVPVPLDEASLGNATFSGMVVAKHAMGQSQEIEFTILRSPVCANDKDTSDFCRDQVLQAISDASDIVVAPPVQPSPPSSTLPTAVSMVAASTASAADTLEFQPVVQYVQDGIADNVLLPIATNCPTFSFGHGIRAFESEQPAAIVNLPVLFGVAEGVSALALGQTPIVPVPTAQALKHKLVVVHLNGDWLDSLPPACKTRCNGIFVLHADESIHPPYDRDGREAAMNSLCVNGLCMAGPNAIVLVQMSSQLYWYRGVRWPNTVLPTLPDFGENVTALFERLLSTQEFPAAPFLTIVQDTDRRVLHKGEMQSVESVVVSLASTSLEDIVDHQDSFCDLVTQISVMFKPFELAKVVTEFTSALDGMITKMVKPKLDEAFAHRDSGGDIGKLKQLVGTYKGEVRSLRKQIKPLSAKLASASSKRGLSNRKGDLKRLERQNAVAANVDKVKNMTLEEKLEFLEDHCSEIGLFIACVDSEPFNRMMDGVAGAEADFSALLTSSPPSIVRTHPRIGVALDALTTGCMIELCIDNHDHPFAAPKSDAMAFVPSTSYADQHTSAIPIVCRDENVDSKDFKEYHWPDHANKPQSSTWRLMFSGAIAKAYSNRNRNISPQNPNVRWFMCHLLLSVLEEVKGTMSKVPDPLVDFDNTNCQILRGVFGELLCVYGSGASMPLSMLWQFFKPNSSLSQLTAMEQSFLVRMLEILPYTCLPTTIFRRNCRCFIIKLIRRYVTDPATKPMRKATTQIDALAAATHTARRNEELAWQRLAVSLILDTEGEKPFSFSKDNADNESVASRLLQQKPPTYDSELVDCIEQLSKGTFKWSEKQKYMRQMAFNIYIKRGCPFKAYLEPLRTKEELDVMEIKEWFDNQYKALQSKFGVDFVKWHNKDGRSNPSRNKIRSDSEGFRLAWFVECGKSLPDRSNFQTKLDQTFQHTRNAILARESPTTPFENSVGATDDTAVVSFEDRLEREVGAISRKAVALYRQIKDTSTTEWSIIVPQDRSEINYHALLHLVDSVGNTDINDIVRRVSKILIEQWRDPVKGEDDALEAVFHFS